MTNNTEYEVPTWNQIYDMLIDQAQEIKQISFKPDIIIGISRGGLVPARILTDLLETPQSTTIGIEFYVGIAQRGLQPILKQPLVIPVDGKRVLLIDDISDSGQSLKLAKNYLLEKRASEVRVATLYVRTSSLVKPDFFEKESDCWIVFPWEIKETLRKVMEKYKGKRAVNQEIAKLVKAGLPKQLVEKALKTMH